MAGPIACNVLRACARRRRRRGRASCGAQQAAPCAAAPAAAASGSAGSSRRAAKAPCVPSASLRQVPISAHAPSLCRNCAQGPYSVSSSACPRGGESHQAAVVAHAGPDAEKRRRRVLLDERHGAAVRGSTARAAAAAAAVAGCVARLPLAAQRVHQHRLAGHVAAVVHEAGTERTHGRRVQKRERPSDGVRRHLRAAGASVSRPRAASAAREAGKQRRTESASDAAGTASPRQRPDTWRGRREGSEPAMAADGTRCSVALS